MKNKTVRFLLIALLLLLPLSVYAAGYHPFPPPLYEQTADMTLEQLQDCIRRVAKEAMAGAK